MEKSEFRVLIKFYYLRGKTISQIKTKLNKYFPGSAPSIGTIHKWFTEFKCGRTSTEDAVRRGRPNEVITPEMITKVHDLILNDPKITLREIAQTVSISMERVGNILHKHLHLKKLGVKWVPEDADDEKVKNENSEENDDSRKDNGQKNENNCADDTLDEKAIINGKAQKENQHPKNNKSNNHQSKRPASPNWKEGPPQKCHKTK